MERAVAPSIWDAGHRRTTIGLLTLVTLVAFEAMAVGTAMPGAVAELDGVAWYAWPFSAFLVTSVVGMVVGGEVGDRRSPGPGVLAGVLTFATGLLIAGVSQHMAVLVLGRAVQGLGAGVVIVLLYVIAGQAFSPELRPRLFGAFAAGWVLPAPDRTARRRPGDHARRLARRLPGPAAAGRGGLALLLGAGADAARPTTRPGRRRAPVGPAGRRRHRRPAVRRPAARRVAVGIAIVGAALAAGLRRCCRGARSEPAGDPAVVASRGLLAGAFFGMDALLPLILTAVHGFSATAAGCRSPPGRSAGRRRRSCRAAAPTAAGAGAPARVRPARGRPRRHRPRRACPRSAAGRPT